MSVEFVHLKCHTEYSIVDAMVHVNQLVDGAVDDQMPAVAVTDFVNLFAWVKFYKRATAAGVKPIIGADVVVRDGDSCSRVTLLCKNNLGYRNLTELISRAYLEGQHAGSQPEMSWSWLKEKSDGLIVLSGALKGDVGQALLKGNADQAERYLTRWREVFGDRYYLEIVRCFYLSS